MACQDSKFLKGTPVNKLTNPDFLTKRQIIDRLTDPNTGRPAISLRTLERHLSDKNIQRSGRPGTKVLIAWKDYLVFKNNLEQGLI